MCVIEKHFTLSKKLKGPDHKASLEPHELKLMIKNVRETEKMLGSFDKKITPSEHKTKLKVRKSLVASRNIKKVNFLVKKIYGKKTGHGNISNRDIKIFGKKSNVNFKKMNL